jgi:SNF2 family DNA or RNA helicase
VGSLKLTEQGLEISFATGEGQFISKVSPFLVVVLKASRLDSRFLVTQGELGRALEAIVHFCDKNSIPLNLDEPARRFLSELRAERDEFAEASRRGGAPSRVEGLQLEGLVRCLTAEQRESVAHVLTVGHGANFSVPGAGKTTIALAAYAGFSRQALVDRLIVVAPRSAFKPWEEEFEACLGRPPTSVRLTGDPASRDRIYARSSDFELFLVTYQMAANDVARLAGVCRRHAVFLILDESHHVKRLEEGQWADAVLALAPHAKRRLVLSGTPMPQGYEDLWTQFTFLWPSRDVLGEKSLFRRQCDSGVTSDIGSRVRPFFRRIRKADLALPPLEVERRMVNLAPHQQRIYDAIRQKILHELTMEPSDTSVLRQWRRAKLVRLIQAASNPALLSEYSEEFQLSAADASDMSVIELARRYAELELPSKLAIASQLVSQLASAGKKVVVWTSFVKNITMFSGLVEGVAPTFVVYGAVPRDYSEDEEFNREQQIAQFKNTDGPAVLVANPAACGESISLHHACTEAIYIDRTFDCAKFLQSQDRIHRLGLEADQSVRLQILLCTDTIDETIDARLEAKSERMQELLEGELPQGSFSDVDDSEVEEALDFDAAMNDLRRRNP